MCFVKDSLSSGDDEDYDEDPGDGGNENGESTFSAFYLSPVFVSFNFMTIFFFVFNFR